MIAYKDSVILKRCQTQTNNSEFSLYAFGTFKFPGGCNMNI
jgi:hypothetical protein